MKSSSEQESQPSAEHETDSEPDLRQLAHDQIIRRFRPGSRGTHSPI